MARPKTFDRAEVLEAALTIVDRGGLAALTIGAVASELSVTPMALYRHVTSKDDLLDGLVEVLVGEVAAEALCDTSDTLQQLVQKFVDASLAVARRHSEAFLLLLIRPVVTKSGLAIRRQFHELLRGSGVPKKWIVTAERALTSTVFAMAAGNATTRFSTTLTKGDTAIFVAFALGGLREVIEASRTIR